jgi:hypothetical protein
MAEEAHEPSTVSVRAVLIGAAVIAGSVLVALLASWGLLRMSGEPRPRPTPAAQPFARVSGPPLEVTPQTDLARYRAEQRRKLSSYRLIDKQAGVVQIPIERAMALVAQEHDAGEPDAPAEAAKPDAGARREADARGDEAARRGGLARSGKGAAGASR